MDGCFFQSSTHYSVIYFSYRKETSISVLKGQRTRLSCAVGPPLPHSAGRPGDSQLWQKCRDTVGTQPGAVQMCLKRHFPGLHALMGLRTLELGVHPRAYWDQGHRARHWKPASLSERCGEGPFVLGKTNKAPTLLRQEHEALERGFRSLPRPEGSSICPGTVHR